MLHKLRLLCGPRVCLERRSGMAKNRLVGLAILIVFFAVMLSSCQTPAGRTAGEVVDDTTITTKVKAKLFKDSILRGFAISVTTFEGEVTLTGAVDTEAEKKRAESIALSTAGVKKVHNLLKLKHE